MKAALAANESAPDTYPTAEDGHVQLTWHQVQYYLLEKVLTSDTEAQAKAAEKGFDWQDRDITGAASAPWTAPPLPWTPCARMWCSKACGCAGRPTMWAR